MSAASYSFLTSESPPTIGINQFRRLAIVVVLVTAEAEVNTPTVPLSERTAHVGIQPSTIMRLATSGPARRTRCAEEHPSGDTFHRENGSENLASSTATHESHKKAWVTPAPKAGPFIDAIIGLGKFINYASGLLPEESASRLAKTAPEQKYEPLPVIITS